MSPIAARRKSTAVFKPTFWSVHYCDRLRCTYFLARDLQSSVRKMTGIWPDHQLEPYPTCSGNSSIDWSSLDMLARLRFPSYVLAYWLNDEGMVHIVAQFAKWRWYLPPLGLTCRQKCQVALPYCMWTISRESRPCRCERSWLQSSLYRVSIGKIPVDEPTYLTAARYDHISMIGFVHVASSRKSTFQDPILSYTCQLSSVFVKGPYPNSTVVMCTTSKA